MRRRFSAFCASLAGGLWLSGEGLGVPWARGLLEKLFDVGYPEEITGTEYGRTFVLIAEPRGSVLHTDMNTLVRREADGRIERLLTPGATTAYGPLQRIGSNLVQAGSSLYWTDDLEDRVVRYDLGVAACDNGLDGDGATDFPTDTAAPRPRTMASASCATTASTTPASRSRSRRRPRCWSRARCCWRS